MDTIYCMILSKQQGKESIQRRPYQQEGLTRRRNGMFESMVGSPSSSAYLEAQLIFNSV